MNRIVDNEAFQSESLSNQLDAFLPRDMAKRAEDIGVTKASLPAGKMLLLSVLAGAFISLGAIFATTVTSGAANQMPYGVNKLLGGIAFSLGLVLVVVAGAELFTGNNLTVMALASGKITWKKLLRGWVIVYVGNFIGSISTAAIMLVARQYEQGGGAVGLNALAIANGKCQLDFLQALALGALCNALVCLAIWISYSARSTTDKILSVIFPITAFVAAGFEHSVANMYFIPIGLFIKATAPFTFWETIGHESSEYASLTWNNFLVANLVPVTLGNIFGGALMVGLVYWYIHLRKPN